MQYTPRFTRPYPDGYKNRPDLTTLVTAAILNMQDDTFEAIENYLVQLEVPSKMSDLDNNLGFITKTVSNLANYYTKAAVDNLIASVSGNLNIEVVTALPTTGISTTTFYLVPKSNSEEQNLYDEYINTDGTESGWERLGDVSTDVDMSDYYTKSEVDEKIPTKTSDLTNSSGFVKLNRLGITVTTNEFGIASTGLEINDVTVVSAYTQNTAGDIIIPFTVGSQWWIKAIGWRSDSAVTNKTIDITVCSLEVAAGGVRPMVPSMTSDTTPSGIVSASYVYPGRAAWWAFSGEEPNINTGYGYWYCNTAGGYLQYEFESDVEVKKIELLANGNPSNGVYTITVSSSDDGATYTEVAAVTFETQSAGRFSPVTVNLQPSAMRYIRFSSDKADTSLGQIQVYGTKN